MQYDKFFTSVPDPTELSRYTWRQMVDKRPESSQCHYRFMMDANWQQLDLAASPRMPQTRFTPIARFGDTHDRGGQIELSLSKLPRECGAAEWLDIELNQSGETILQRRNHYTLIGSMADVLSTWKGESQEYLIRSIVLKNDGYVLRGRCTTPTDRSGGYAQLFAGMLGSINWIHPTDDLAEPVQVCTLGNYAVKLPASWTVEHQETDEMPDESQFIVMTNRHEQERCAGEIRVIRTTNSESLGANELMRRYLARLRDGGLKFSQQSIEQIDTKEAFNTGFLVSPDLSGDSDRFDAPFLLFENANELILIGMLTENYTTSPIWYAINKRAFEIVRDSITMN